MPMDLPTIWFVIIAFLFAGFFFLEGFDYGAGMWLLLLSKKEGTKQEILNAIGGVWDGNEVWMITAGAALFAAFPHWYATLFSGFYLPLLLMLLALILRGTGLKFRGHGKSDAWRWAWDGMIFIGSLVPAFLWGVVVGNLLRGIPINEQMHYAGSLRDLVSPYCLMAGFLFTCLFLLHGAVFLNLKVSNEVLSALRSRLTGVYLLTVGVAIAFLVWSAVEVRLFDILAVRLFVADAVAALLICGLALYKRPGLAFLMTGLTIILLGASVFMYLYPRVMISSLDPAWDLTVWNASSSAYSLEISSIIALTFIPLVLIYQGWTYWVLRQRVSRNVSDY